MKNPVPSFNVLLLLALVFSQGSDASQEEIAREIIEATGIKGGFVAHIGSGDGSLTMALKRSESYQVQGLDRDQTKVDAARKMIREKGLYGPVCIERLDGDRLPYTSGMVNLVVAEADSGITQTEIERVLTPLGVAYVKNDSGRWEKTVKPWPKEIDDWTHYLHNAGGNAVAQDSVVGPPSRMQWVGSPRWSRHHDRMASMSALVSAKGRLFYIMDEGSRISIQLPPKWTLIGRDGFNGTILWKREIPEWSPHLWPLKSGPTQLARRLVAIDEKVFTTLGIVAPISILDAATGETIRELAGSGGAEEIVVEGNTVYAIVMKEERELANYLPKANTGDQARVKTEFAWNEVPRVIMAFDAETGAEKWHKVSVVSPLTLAAAGGRLYYHDGDKLVATNGDSGEVIWETGKANRVDVVNFNFGPKLVVTEDLVLFAGGDREMHAYEAATGVERWSAPHARGGYQSPEDLLVAQGKVWSAALLSGGDDGIFYGRSLKTGEVEVEFPPNVDTYWFHHRCYISKATERFIMPSRTGIEFVDMASKDWEIHHWVRGGCLYGVMPCNGLTYAPPHNCACYPEAKLYGFNALAPDPVDAKDVLPDPINLRLEKGPAFGTVPTEAAASEGDWPTYRHDNTRSGATGHQIDAAKLKEAWTADLGGNLSSVVVADGLAFVAQIDEHTVHAIDSGSGEIAWSFMAGGRVDSPPTIYQGSVVFGSRDGWVYCLRAKDGVLAWRFRDSPQDRRIMAFEQLESAWPLHGNILIESGTIYAVAGRSNFLDGGLRMYLLDPKTGKVIGEKIINEINPETGRDIQEDLQTLQMPVGLPDILSASGGYVYMKSQQFDLNGDRLEIGVHSGDAAANAAVQAGEGRHLFAPMSFLDQEWFHRSYWVFGKSFSRGHNGYYQAAKNTPGGRLLVFDDEKVFGFGRKPEYLKWTTTMEHQLFSAPIDAPEGALTAVEDKDIRRGESGAAPKGGEKGKAKAKGPATASASMIRFEIAKTLDPSGKPLVVEARVKAEGREGVILARGGPSAGYALIQQGGKPAFVYRSKEGVAIVSAEKPLGKDWNHLVATISTDKSMKLFVNGQLAGEGKAPGLIDSDPKQTMEIGADDSSAVGYYKSPFAFSGLIDEVKLYFGELSDEEAATLAKGEGSAPTAERVVMACSFDEGDAHDLSGNNNHGTLLGGVTAAAGWKGGAALFTGATGAAGTGKPKGNAVGGGTLVQFDWTQDIPIIARAMVKTGSAVFVAGPPDMMNEEETFVELTEGDPEVQKLLAEQDAALEGEKGGILRAVSSKDGSTILDIEMASLPSWDGMAAAGGRIFITTTDGKVLCYSE